MISGLVGMSVPVFLLYSTRNSLLLVRQLPSADTHTHSLFYICLLFRLSLALHTYPSLSPPKRLDP